ncbi:MAG: acylphosphatase [Deltaproteobacteria bacterium]|nr:acylphosphatase [Deltaproteobacteria bacterium]
MQVHIIIKGKVQGVSYRYYTERAALKLRLKGTVMNLQNGDVEIYAEGEDQVLKELIDWCWKGSPAAVVSNVVVNEVHVEKEFILFHTIY